MNTIPKTDAEIDASIRTVAAFNGLTKRLDLAVKLKAGRGYYYWLRHDDDMVASAAESVYVYRFAQVPASDWLRLAREADAAEADAASKQALLRAGRTADRILRLPNS